MGRPTSYCVCTLKHPELLDAAHITEDGADGGDPVVTNGLSLCKIHHAAYDRLLHGITAEYEVRINQGLLDEIDGPMLRHGLQEMHRRPLTLPRHRNDCPDPDGLERRFSVFAAGLAPEWQMGWARRHGPYLRRRCCRVSRPDDPLAVAT